MNPAAVARREAGQRVLLTGNEAVVRGALEAGVDFAAAYPGSPSSEILEVLAALSPEFGHYAQWSVNEKVALEAAAGASLAGLRAMASMKPNGLNVASDFLMHLAMTGSPGGLVLVVCDDPQGHSSTNEQDSRPLAAMADVPVLEPADFGEARDMTRWAFDLSEELGMVCMVRSVTRIAHARGNLTLGPIPPRRAEPVFGPDQRFVCMPGSHRVLHQRMERAREIFTGSPFNSYSGPEDASLVIVTCGTGHAYAREALELLGIGGRVGVLKLGTTWPVPAGLLRQHLVGREAVLFLEEVDPFVEDRVLAFLAAGSLVGAGTRFYGKGSGHVAGSHGPGTGELSTDLVLATLAKLPAGLVGRANWSMPGLPVAADGITAGGAKPLEVPPRELAFCPGCPHRASYWALNAALELDGRGGFVVGDIGCYTLGAFRTGYHVVRTVHAMGGGLGLANGFGQLARFGFDQPVIAVVGDSTFFHAGLTALINARYNNADFLCVVLDNSTTAMTGFQPHPGIGRTAAGDPTPPVSVEMVCSGMGIPVQVTDPFRLTDTTAVVYDLLQKPGVKVLVLRQPCALLARDEIKAPYYVDQERCLGDGCGCAAFCTRVFACPGNVWDRAADKARIDEVVCNGCGVCADLCPAGAIKPMEVKGQCDR